MSKIKKHKPAELEYSDDFYSEISQPPNWLLKSGMWLFIIIILGLLLFSLFIKYPFELNGKFVVYSHKPSIYVTTPNEGLIGEVLVKDGQNVNSGHVLAVLVSTTSYQRVIQLETILNKCSSLIMDSTFTQSISVEHFIDSLGSLENEYQLFLKAWNDFVFFKNNNNYNQQLDALNQKITIKEKLLEVITDQKKYYKDVLDNGRWIHATDSMLYKKDGVSKLELINSKNEFLSIKISEREYEQKLLQIQSDISDYQNEIENTKFRMLEDSFSISNDLIESMQLLREAITSWKESYCLIANYSGKVEFLTNVHPFLPVQNKAAVFAISSKNPLSSYEGELVMSVIGAGKLRIGDKVVIKLDDFPYHDYGVLYGKIKHIPNIPIDGNYHIKVEISSMITSNNLAIPEKPILFGSGEVVISDVSLFEHFFNKYTTFE